MPRSTTDMVKDYLKGHFYVEEVDLPYEQKDGRIMFFISIYKLQQRAEELSKKRFGEQAGQEFAEKDLKILDDILKDKPVNETGELEIRRRLEEEVNKLREQIREEEVREMRWIIEEKLDYSKPLGRTKGFYKTIFDMLRNGETGGFERWQEEHTPNLVNLEQGIYVEDKCCSEPKCGYCGDYIFLKKKEREKEVRGNGRQAEFLITQLEQGRLFEIAKKYVFGRNLNFDSQILDRFDFVMANLQGKPFRDMFNAKKIVDEQGKDPLNSWVIYNNILDIEKDFSNKFGNIESEVEALAI